MEGTKLISEIEQAVSSKMTREQDYPIENDRQLDRLMEFEEKLVAKYLAKARQSAKLK